MKTSKKRVLLLRRLLFVVLIVIIGSCTVEDETITSDESAAIVSENQSRGPNLSTVEQQLAFLTIKMRRFHNIQVAHAQGWNFEGPTIPFMGVHWLNLPLMDETFDMLNPEALVYVPDADGNMHFGAAEYIHTGSEADGPPEGFIGEEDVWFYIGGVGWTLHVWVGLENPDGVFAAANPLVILP